MNKNNVAVVSAIVKFFYQVEPANLSPKTKKIRSVVEHRIFYRLHLFHHFTCIQHKQTSSIIMTYLILAESYIVYDGRKTIKLQDRKTYH